MQILMLSHRAELVQLLCIEADFENGSVEAGERGLFGDVGDLLALLLILIYFHSIW